MSSEPERYDFDHSDDEKHDIENYEAMAYDEDEDYDEEEGCEDNWITLGLEPRGS